MYIHIMLVTSDSLVCNIHWFWDSQVKIAYAFKVVLQGWHTGSFECC